MENSLKGNNYIVIQSFMVNELKLKGNELLVYAIIYSFSQDGTSKFSGSLQYLADWTNSTKQGIIKNLKSLLEKNLIAKKVQTIGGVNSVEYYATKFNGGIKQSLPNNINNNKESIYINIYTKESELFNSFWSAYPKKVGKKNVVKWFDKNKPNEELVNKMIDKINQYKLTDNWKKNNGQFIPYPYTWLNAESWNDELEVKSEKPKNPNDFVWISRNGSTFQGRRYEVQDGDKVSEID